MFNKEGSRRRENVLLKNRSFPEESPCYQYLQPGGVDRGPRGAGFLLIFGTTKTSVFSKDELSTFASIVLDSILAWDLLALRGSPDGVLDPR